MKAAKWFMILFALLLVVPMAWADSGEGDDGTQLGVKADMRWRGELDGRDFDKDINPSAFSVLRARFGAYVKSGDVKGFIQLQYPHQLGWDASTLNPDVAADVHQAYLKVHGFFTDPLTLKVGRMEMSYGDERLIGAVGWSNVGRVFDGVLLRYDTEKYSVDGFYTKQVERYSSAAYTDDQDDNFFGVWAKYKPLKLNLFALQNTAAAMNSNGDYATNSTLTTVGLHYMNMYESGFGAILDGAYQMGTTTTFGPPSVDTDVAAWMLVVGAWYKFDMAMEPGVGVGVDWVSGDDPDTPDKWEAFNNLYYTSHRWRGSMDLFTASNPEGLRDVELSVMLKPTEKRKVWLSFHNFSTSQEYASLVDGSKTTAVGNEIDLESYCQMKEDLGFQMGIGYFMPAEDYMGTDPENGLWGYVQLQAKMHAFGSLTK